MNTALIFAGGSGSRMSGARIPKQFLESGGKPIIAHTIKHFQIHPQIDAVVVVCLEDWIPHMEKTVANHHLDKVKAIVPGGKTGQDSIYSGLCALEELGLADEDDIVLVHDGVRPLIDEPTITACIDSVRQRGCTATVAPAVETVLEMDGDSVVRIADRSSCRLARAPQGFKTAELIGAHRKAQSDNAGDFIDSISLMAHYGYPIFTVDGPVENIKITTPSDFFAFKGYTDMFETKQLWE